MSGITPSEGTPSKRPPALHARPSRSEPPGASRLFAALTVDPVYLVFRFVVAIAEGVTTGILKWRARKKQEKAEKALKRAVKKGE